MQVDVNIDPLSSEGRAEEFDPYKLMGLGSICPRVLRELAGGVARPLFIIFEKS